MQSFNIQDCILYEDKDILVCHKPAGVAVQSARFGMADMESSLKNHLALKTPGKMPCLGIIHRLDQPVWHFPHGLRRKISGRTCSPCYRL